jgi:D-alanine-D-alanine ligase
MSVIETAIETDGTSILRITATGNIFTPSEIDCVQELWNAYQAKGEESGYVFLVYREHGWTLGYACFGPHPLTQGTFDLYWIAVDPEARGRGIGHALLRRVEAEASARGGRLLLIETSDLPIYAAARRLYETGGYRYEAVVHDFYGPGDSLLIFAKSLEPALGMRDFLAGVSARTQPDPFGIAERVC